MARVPEVTLSFISDAKAGCIGLNQSRFNNSKGCIYSLGSQIAGTKLPRPCRKFPANSTKNFGSRKNDQSDFCGMMIEDGGTRPFAKGNATANNTA